MTRLRSCDACARHVFVTEQVCPFCQAPLAAAPEPARVSIASGASRAQRLALAAAIGGTSLLGCTDEETQTDRVEMATPIYGAPVAGDPSPTTAGRGAPDPSPPAPAYGAPLPGNPAPPAAGSGGDIAAPVYGAPLAGSPAMDDDAGVPEAGAPAAGSGGAGGAGGAGGFGGDVAVPVYGAPLPEYGAPPPPKD
jgi:hypothetical protein